MPIFARYGFEFAAVFEGSDPYYIRFARSLDSEQY